VGHPAEAQLGPLPADAGEEGRPRHHKARSVSPPTAGRYEREQRDGGADRASLPRYDSTMQHNRGCPTCNGPRAPIDQNASFPFCSPRCKLADLGRWLDGSYAIPGEPAPEEDSEQSGDARWVH